MIALFEKWGYEGFDAHVRSVSTFYRAKRDAFQALMEEYMAGLAEWTPPNSGLFFWSVSPGGQIAFSPIQLTIHIAGSSGRLLGYA